MILAKATQKYSLGLGMLQVRWSQAFAARQLETCDRDPLRIRSVLLPLALGVEVAILTATTDLDCRGLDAGNLRCHNTLFTAEQQLISSPSRALDFVHFLLDLRVLQKLTVFVILLIALLAEWSPRFPYSAIFGDVTPAVEVF